MTDIYANFLELWGLTYLGDLSKYMYKADLYTAIFYVMTLLPLVVWFLYYKAIDSIKLANIKAWLIILLVIFIITGIFTYAYSYNEVMDFLFKRNITKYDINYSDIFTLSLIASVWSAIFSLIWSWVLKNFSVKSRNIPF